MVYDEWMISRVMLSLGGADVHTVLQHVTAYSSAARLLDSGTALGRAAQAEVEGIVAHHERVLRSYLVTGNITESRDLIRRLTVV